MNEYIITKGPLYVSATNQTIEGIRRPVLVKEKIRAKFYRRRGTAEKRARDLNILLKPATKYEVKEITIQVTTG